jgi:2-methylcitrate dehydratase PrpD
MVDPTGITFALANWVTRTRFEDVPDDVIHGAKRLVLDVLANAIGGSSTSAAELGMKPLRALGGAEQSTVLVHGFRTSAPHAAFANVLMASALEADDTPLQLGHHAHTAVLPALALAEQKPTSGSDYLLAVALGYEFGIRVALAARHARVEPDGSVTRSTTGNGVNFVVFPAVVGAAKVLQVDASCMRSALGIAGVTATIPTGARWRRPPFSHMKYNPYAFMAQSATLAALLAASGFTGDPAIFDADGEADWWQMSGALESHPEDSVRELGETWWMRETSLKPWPSCRYTHGPVNLFGSICREAALTPGDLEQVDIWSHSGVTRFHMESPLVETEADCAFSLPHVLAMTALDVPPGPQWVSPEYWNNAAVESIKARVRTHVSAQMDKAFFDELLSGPRRRSPHSVRVVTKDGRTFERTGELAPGDPQSPETYLDDKALIGKFQRFTERVLPAAAIDACTETVMSLHEVPDVRNLVEHLARGTGRSS